MHSQLPPAEMTADERRHELAAIFARGILRLQKRRLTAADSNGEKPALTNWNGLELPPPARLSGTDG